LIDWCFTPTLAIFQLYRGLNNFFYDHVTDVVMCIHIWNCSWFIIDQRSASRISVIHRTRTSSMME